jgi:hypothetical protein
MVSYALLVLNSISSRCLAVQQKHGCHCACCDCKGMLPMPQARMQ